MIAAAAALLVLMPVPQDPAAAEAKARADLAHAVQHVDALLRLTAEAQDRAKAAGALADATAQSATQLDRARLAKLASDLGAQLAALQQTLATQSEAIRAARIGIDAELPAAAEGTVPWFADRLRETQKFDTHKKASDALRRLEREVQADAVRKQPGAEALLGHTRYLLAESLRQEADGLARDNATANALVLFDAASKKLDEVLKGADAADTGECSSLHALALRRQVEIEAKLYWTYQPLVPQKPDLASKANHHRRRALAALESLERVHGRATMPSGELVVDAARAAVERLRAR